MSDKKVAMVIPLFPDKPQARVPKKCSFCLKETPVGQYINNESDPKSPTICFECVRLATERLKENDNA